MFKNKNKGFSLLELIIAIAVLVTMLLVLTPSVVKYVDETRTTKDIKTSADLTEVIEASLTENSVYQEITDHIVGKYKGDRLNYSSYVDKHPSELDEYRESLGEDSYTFGEKARVIDGMRYMVAGQMRGVTITFPVIDKKIDYQNGRINEIKDGDTVGHTGSLLLKDAAPSLVDFIKSKFGKNIPIDSATYRFSDFTIFIYTGAAVTAEETAGAAMKVYGQWDGTNLIDVERDHNAIGGASGSAPLNPTGTVPDGGIYTDSAGNVIEGGAEFPSDTKEGDSYEYGDYTYTYVASVGGWSVRVLDNTKSSYGAILETVNNKQVKVANSAFKGCTKLTSAPQMPESIMNVDEAFSGCIKLTTPPDLSRNVLLTSANMTFKDCTSLTGVVKVPCHITVKAWANCPAQAQPCHYSGCGHELNGSEQIIPQGGIYVRGLIDSASCDTCASYWCSCNAIVYTAGDVFPSTVNKYDLYIQSDYAYMYQAEYGCNGCPYIINVAGYSIEGFHSYCNNTKDKGGWTVGVVDRKKTNYSAMLEEVNGVKVKNCESTYESCLYAEVVSPIPQSVVLAEYYVRYASNVRLVKHPCHLTTISVGSETTKEVYHYDGCGHTTGSTGTTANKIPSGGTYYQGIRWNRDDSVCNKCSEWCTCQVSIYAAGNSFPASVRDYDLYVYGDYIYMYNGAYGRGCPYEIIINSQTYRGFYMVSATCDGWTVGVTNTLKTSYGAFLDSINGKQVKMFDSTFYGCTNATSVPTIPSIAYDISSTFAYCEQLRGPVQIPCTANGAFYWYNCTADYEFYHYAGCGHTTIPTGGTYYTNVSMNTGNYISQTGTRLARYVWADLSSAMALTGGQSFPLSPKKNDIYVYDDYVYIYGTYFDTGSYRDCEGWSVIYNGTSSNPSPFVSELLGQPVTHANHTYEGLDIVTSPTIPSSVINMSYCFAWCDQLSGPVTINATPTVYYCCILDTKVTEILGQCTIKNAIMQTK